MSKLPNAPLVEVVFELRWNIRDKGDLAEVQYLQGDLYSEIKSDYPQRKSIVPLEIPIELLLYKPTHRFVPADKDYPLVQIGPGILTLNTDDENYFWSDFSQRANDLISKLLKVYKIPSESIVPSLLFLDFFPFNFKEQDVFRFINNNFNVSFSQSFLETDNIFPSDINFSNNYSIEEGSLFVAFQKGNKNRNNNILQTKEEGIILQTKVNGNLSSPQKDLIMKWLSDSQERCSCLFKNLVKKELYNSFK